MVSEENNLGEACDTTEVTKDGRKGTVYRGSMTSFINYS